MHGGRKYLPRKVLILTCKVCGDPFKATRPDARYCKSACRSIISRASRAGQGSAKLFTTIKTARKT